LSDISAAAAKAGGMPSSNEMWSQQFGCRRCQFTQAPSSGLQTTNAANISAVS
jgi:hypothetical protein